MCCSSSSDYLIRNEIGEGSRAGSYRKDLGQEVSTCYKGSMVSLVVSLYLGKIIRLQYYGLGQLSWGLRCCYGNLLFG
jgi:hypothetical protein